jgi:hypothetical protein
MSSFQSTDFSRFMEDISAGIGAGLQAYDPNNIFAGAGAAMSASAASRRSREAPYRKMEADMAKMDAAATRARGEAAIAAAAAAAAAEVGAVGAVADGIRPAKLGNGDDFHMETQRLHDGRLLGIAHDGARRREHAQRTEAIAAVQGGALDVRGAIPSVDTGAVPSVLAGAAGAQ